MGITTDANSEWDLLQHEIIFDRNSSKLTSESFTIIQKLCDWSQKYKATLQIMAQWQDGEQPDIARQRALEVLKTIQMFGGSVMSNVTMIHGESKAIIKRL